MVLDALSDAQCFCLASRVSRVVLESRNGNDRGQQGVQRQHHQAAAQGAPAIHPEAVEERSRTTDAEEVRARRHVSVVEATAVSLRRVHVQDEDQRNSGCRKLP